MVIKEKQWKCQHSKQLQRMMGGIDVLLTPRLRPCQDTLLLEVLMSSGPCFRLGLCKFLLCYWIACGQHPEYRSNISVSSHQEHLYLRTSFPPAHYSLSALHRGCHGSESWFLWHCAHCCERIVFWSVTHLYNGIYGYISNTKRHVLFNVKVNFQLIETDTLIGSLMRQSRLHQEKSIVFCYDNCTLTYIFTFKDSLCKTPHKSIYSMAFQKFT